MRRRNETRAARMRERNFPARRIVGPTCIVALKLAEYQRKRGAKMQPAGWSRCWGPVDPAHVVHARGMGGCNSGKTEVAYICRGHHREQEGHTAEFEAKYQVDLKTEAAKVAAGAEEPGAPA